MKRVLAALALLVSMQANAYILTIDPDDYAHGTDLSHIAPGLTLNALRQPFDSPESSTYAPVVAPLLAVDCVQTRCGAHEGTRGFGFELSYGISQGFGEINLWDQCRRGFAGACRDGYNVIEMVFDQPTDYLRLESVWGSDPAAIMVFNSAGERLMYCGAAYFPCPDIVHTEMVNGDYNSTFVVERAEADIARVVFGGIIGSAHLGEMSYNVNVPEPGTLALLSVGLFGLLGAGRRRRINAASASPIA